MMKRHVCTLICAMLIVATVLAFAGCSAHQHTYTDAWSVDAENHWHAATCTDGNDCSEAVASKAAHVDANSDKICDVCGYDYDHTHTYAETYSSDASYHWFAVSCGCTVDGKDKAAHVDANNDATCDVCGYSDHTHEFNKEAWVADENSHWYAPTCSHSVKDSEAAHSFNDVDRCEVCGYVKGGKISVSSAVSLGEHYADLVNGGVISIVSDSNGYVSEKAVAFTFGKDNVVYAIDSLSYGYLSQSVEYHTLYNGALFSMIEEMDYNGNWQDARKYNPNSASVINGYEFAHVIDWSEENDIFYGTEDLVAGLYEIAKTSDGFVEMVLQYEGKNIYVYTFNTSVYDGYDSTTYQPIKYLYEIEVVFTLSDDCTIETVSVTSSQHTCEADEPTPGATDTYHVVGLVPNKVSTYVIAQTVGERTAEAKYSPAQYWATDWELVDAEGNVITDTINVNAGKYNTFTIKAKAPETADISMDNIEVTCEGINVYNWGETINFTAYTEGTYQVTVKTSLKSATYTVEVAPAKLESLSPFVMDNGWKDTSNPFTARVDESGKASVIFGAEPNSGASTTITATVDNGGTLVKNDDGTYTLTDATVGTYTVTIVADADNTVTATLVITVAEAQASQGLTGTYEAQFYGTTMFVLTFGENNTVTVEDMSTYTTTTYTLEWDAYWGYYNLMTAEGMISGYSIADDGFGGWTFSNGRAQLALTPRDDSAAPISGKMYDSTDNNWGLDFGTESFLTDYNTWTNYYFSYTYADGVITVTFTDASAPFADATWTYDSSTGNITITAADSTQTVFTEFSWG